MAEKELKLIFKAVDEATPVIEDLTGAAGDKGIGGISNALLGLSGGFTMAAAGFSTVAYAVSEMMADWREHVISIGDFAAVLGISAEEASALNMIAEDYNITQANMLTAMENLVKEGLDPTIKGLVEARDIIYESEDPTVRLTTAMDLLGKKGAEDLMPMFQDLGGELEFYIENMDESEVVTRDLIEAAREQQEAIDVMKGAWESFSMGIMSTFAPYVTSLIEVLNELFIVQEMNISQFIRWRIEEAKTRGSSGGSYTPSVHEDYRLTQIGATSGGGSNVTRGSSSRRGGLQEFQHGGAFTIGGFGGPDSQLVQFMGSPGERVEVGGGGGEMAALLAEIRRLVTMMPVTVRDAVERVI